MLALLLCLSGCGAADSSVTAEHSIEEMSLPGVFEATGIQAHHAVLDDGRLNPAKALFILHDDGPALSMDWAEALFYRIVDFNGKNALACFSMPHTGVSLRALRVWQVIDGRTELVYDENWKEFIDDFTVPDFWLEGTEVF